MIEVVKCIGCGKLVPKCFCVIGGSEDHEEYMDFDCMDGYREEVLSYEQSQAERLLDLEDVCPGDSVTVR